MKLKSLSIALFVLAFVSGCEQTANQDSHAPAEVSADELLRFISQVKNNLVFVEGGDFLMGDYGVQHGPERLPYDADKDSKPLHRVELSSYSIDRFKITNQNYQFYLKSNGLQLRVMEGWRQKNWIDINGAPKTPAHIDWHEAEKYCSWLARVSGFPFALPTEAQWEYAARSRGQFLMVSTDDGTYQVTKVPVTEHDGPRGVNISTYLDREEFADEMGWETKAFTPLPVDRFPPNPLGLYDMSDNGFEWVGDWYDPNYYGYSPVQDPQGPDTPAFKGPVSNNKYAKVLRGAGYANPGWGGGTNIQRSYSNPDGHLLSLVTEEDVLQIFDKTARCVVNASEPLN
ncbi:formylglycine-generating enzyme family protein [Pseudomonas fluorescens]|uniref:formylglycine-generating enzyme family protein n=1 Tax=Pseudomonas fluorescens TaxID=294 RepID=UPI001CA9E720|nr:SUMF1/EgtB/PvdO family nonheme iron enzyme [Pseudomonas fluorescens]